MALYKLDNYTKQGFLRSRIIPWKDGKQFSINPHGYGKYVGVRRFKYEYTHPQMAPRLYTSHQNGKKYIIPTWQEVLPETTLGDINWIKPKLKVKEKPVIKTHISGSGLGEYTTKYYPCLCP